MIRLALLPIPRAARRHYLSGTGSFVNIFCYQHHINDFRRDTAQLTCEQRGVYRDLLDAYYFNAGNLTADIEQLGRIISVHTDNERAALAHAVMTFFTSKNGKLYQKRASEEIKKIIYKSGKAKQSVSTRWLKGKEKEPYERITNDILTNNQEPITILEPPTPLPKERLHAKRRKPATFISEDFGPDIGSIALCGELNFNVEQTCREFIDYWKSVGEAKADWQAAFRNRIRQLAKYRAERQQGPIAGRSNVTDITGAALRVAARGQEKS